MQLQPSVTFDQSSHRSEALTSKRLKEEIKGNKWEFIPNNKTKWSDCLVLIQQKSLTWEGQVLHSTEGQSLKLYLINCRRSIIRGQDWLSSQLPNWAALFWNGTRCCCVSLLYKRVTLRHDSLTLWLISFSLLQPSPAIRLFWLFPLHLFLIEWTSQSYTSG